MKKRVVTDEENDMIISLHLSGFSPVVSKQDKHKIMAPDLQADYGLNFGII